MSVLLVAIDQIACACACARADQCAFLATNQCAADCADSRPDGNVFHLAGATPVITMMALRRTDWRNRQYHKDEGQQHRYDVSFLNNPYHFHSFYGLSSAQEQILSIAVPHEQRLMAGVMSNDVGEAILDNAGVYEKFV
jgi:hypothetical protein